MKTRNLAKTFFTVASQGSKADKVSKLWLLYFFLIFWPHHLQHGGSWFPKQELNPRPLQWKQSFKHWTPGKSL